MKKALALTFIFLVLVGLTAFVGYESQSEDEELDTIESGSLAITMDEAIEIGVWGGEYDTGVPTKIYMEEGKRYIVKTNG